MKMLMLHSVLLCPELNFNPLVKINETVQEKYNGYPVLIFRIHISVTYGRSQYRHAIAAEGMESMIMKIVTANMKTMMNMTTTINSGLLPVLPLLPALVFGYPIST